MTVSVSKNKMINAASAICRAKRYYDNGKTVVGCTTTVGSFICAAGAVSSSGATVVVCNGIIVYTTDKGFADCIDGVSSAIASALGNGKEWSEIRAQVGASSGQFITVIDKAIDVACADLKKK
jgi:hypothetical protein